MKAKVKYNDYVGTAAADFADMMTLTGYLKSKGLDVDRYEPIGVRFCFGEGGLFVVYFLCVDRNIKNRKVVAIRFEDGISKEEMLNLFKRLEVILTWNKGYDYSTWELDEDVIVINSKKEDGN